MKTPCFSTVKLIKGTFNVAERYFQALKGLGALQEW
jgi:hypothetical protein